MDARNSIPIVPDSTFANHSQPVTQQERNLSIPRRTQNEGATTTTKKNTKQQEHQQTEKKEKNMNCTRVSSTLHKP
jgi:hypothetical protein